MQPNCGTFAGIYAATPCPLKSDLTIDDEAFRRTLDYLASRRGMAGFLINGHAGENTTMRLDDQVRVAQLAVDCVGKQATVVVGVNAENTLEATAHAQQLEAAGADALMIFPPNGWALFQEPDMAVDHHRRIIEATNIPIFLFQASVGAGRMAYPPETLARLASLPRVAAIKEGSWEVAMYEENRRLLCMITPRVVIMGSGDEHLFTSYVIGSSGSLVSLAAVIPDAIIRLFDAVEAGDLGAARAENERIYPIARAIYREAPTGRANARLKTCLKLQGLFPEDVMLPPAQKTSAAETERLASVLRENGALNLNVSSPE